MVLAHRKCPISFISMNSPPLIVARSGRCPWRGEVVVVAGEHHDRALLASISRACPQIVVDRVEVQIALERLRALAVVDQVFQRSASGDCGAIRSHTPLAHT